MPTPRPRSPAGKLGGLSAPQAGYPHPEINSWDVLHSTSHPDAVAAGAAGSASSGVVRRAQLVNTGYGFKAAFINPLDNESRNNLYKKAYDNNDNVCIYTPIQKVLDLTVPAYVIIRGTSTAFDVLKDVNIFVDWASNEYLSVLLAGFYQEVAVITQRIQEHIGARRFEIVSHSLGCKYATAVWHKMQTSAQYIDMRSQLSRVYSFNPYVLRTKEYKALQEADQLEQVKFHYHIVSGDFASILVRNHPPEDAHVTIYDAADTHHETNDYSLYTTLSHYLTSSQFANPSRDEWLSIASHGMENFTPDSAQHLYSPIPLNERVRIRTEHTGSLPQYGVTNATELYMVPNGKLDFPHDQLDSLDLPQFQPMVTVPDETTWTIQDASGTGAILYVLFNIALTYPLPAGDVVTGPIGYTYHSTDPSGSAILRFGAQNEDLTIGTRLRIPSDVYGTYTLPASLIEDPIETYSANIESGHSGLYNFIVTPATSDEAWHSLRRTADTPTWLNDNPSQTIGFQFITDYDWTDSIPVDMYLCHTGGGILKWGHLAIGSLSDYNLPIVSKTGDLFDVMSNTFEIVHWDTGRFSIKCTDQVNGGKYLKRPNNVDIDWDFTQNSTRRMIAGNNRSEFIPIEWHAWDQFHDSPTHFVFEVKPFDSIKIKNLGDSIDNMVNGVIEPTWMLYPQFIRSSNGQYAFSIERTGQGVLSSATQEYIWRTTTDIHGNGIYLAPNGDLVTFTPGTLTDTDHPFAWVSGTQEHPLNIVTGSNYRKMRVTDAGEFQILDINGNVLVSHS